jgi:hypothetical protein
VGRPGHRWRKARGQREQETGHALSQGEARLVKRQLRQAIDGSVVQQVVLPLVGEEVGVVRDHREISIRLVKLGRLRAASECGFY